MFLRLKQLAKMKLLMVCLVFGVTLLLTGCSFLKTDTILVTETDYRSINSTSNAIVYKITKDNIKQSNNFLIPTRKLDGSIDESNYVQHLDRDIYIRMDDLSNEKSFFRVGIEKGSQVYLFSTQGKVVRRIANKDVLIFIESNDDSSVLREYSFDENSKIRIAKLPYTLAYSDSISEIIETDDNIYEFVVEDEQNDVFMMMKYEQKKGTISNEILFTYDEEAENGKTNVNYIEGRDFCIFRDSIIYSTFSNYNEYKLTKYNRKIGSTTNIQNSSNGDYIRKNICIDNGMLFELVNINDNSNIESILLGKREIYKIDKDTNEVTKLTNGSLKAANSRFFIYSDLSDNLYLKYYDSKEVKLISTDNGNINVFVE